MPILDVPDVRDEPVDEKCLRDVAVHADERLPVMLREQAGMGNDIGTRSPMVIRLSGAGDRCLDVSERTYVDDGSEAALQVRPQERERCSTELRAEHEQGRQEGV